MALMGQNSQLRISVSNIAWEPNELDEHLLLLQKLGCEGVDIAPNIIWKEPVEVSQENALNFKKKVEQYQLTIPAFQALLYTRPDLTLFGAEGQAAEKQETTIVYFKQLIRLAGWLNVKVLVYGSPRSRKVGTKNYDDCYGIAVDTFKELSNEALKYETCFCIEPLGASDSCDFINNSTEALALIQDVDSPGFGINLDAKAMMDVQENFDASFSRCRQWMRHFQVNDPELKPPGFTGVDHSKIGKAFAKIDYNGFIALEMRRGFGPSEKVITNAVEFVKSYYS